MQKLLQSFQLLRILHFHALINTRTCILIVNTNNIRNVIIIESISLTCKTILIKFECYKETYFLNRLTDSLAYVFNTKLCVYEWNQGKGERTFLPYSILIRWAGLHILYNVYLRALAHVSLTSLIVTGANTSAIKRLCRYRMRAHRFP